MPGDATAETPDRITELLVASSNGNREALNRLFPVVYDELRRIAHGRLRWERPDHTLSTTALVHEAYLKLVDQTRVQWRSRAHFYGVASEAMRRILVNYAEAAKAAKRGGGAVHVPLEGAEFTLTEPQMDEILSLDQALNRLKAFNPRGADVVVYRFFGGLSYEEIASVLDTSPVTARRAWSAAKTWLRRELGDSVSSLAPSREPS